MTGEGDNSDSGAGYKKPPAATRFRKGLSGNPRGRPKGRHRQAPYEAVLGQMVTIREEGVERKVTAAEAFLLQLAKRGLEGDLSAARKTMTAIDAGKSGQMDEALTGPLSSCAWARRLISIGRPPAWHWSPGSSRRLSSALEVII